MPREGGCGGPERGRDAQGNDDGRGEEDVLEVLAVLNEEKRSTQLILNIVYRTCVWVTNVESRRRQYRTKVKCVANSLLPEGSNGKARGRSPD